MYMNGLREVCQPYTQGIVIEPRPGAKNTLLVRDDLLEDYVIVDGQGRSINS